MTNVIWTESAKTDLLDLVKYIIEENPQAATDFLDSIENMSENISQFPEMGMTIEFHLPVHQVLIHPARMLYIKNNNELIIIACIHQSMDWQSLLLNRGLRDI